MQVMRCLEAVSSAAEVEGRAWGAMPAPQHHLHHRQKRQCIVHSLGMCCSWQLFTMCACVVHAAMLSGACTATFSVYWMMLSLMLSDTSTGPHNCCLIAAMCHVVAHAL